MGKSSKVKHHIGLGAKKGCSYGSGIGNVDLFVLANNLVTGFFEMGVQPPAYETVPAGYQSSHGNTLTGVLRHLPRRGKSGQPTVDGDVSLGTGRPAMPGNQLCAPPTAAG